MKDELLSRMPILAPQAIKLLMLRRTLEVLETCTEQSRTMKEISNAVGMEMGRTWHHVRKLVRTGLLRETGSRKRSGRAQKLYRTSATRFYVPSELRTKTIGSELNKLLETSITFGDNTIGELFYFDGCRWRVENVYEENAPSEAKQHDRWLIARLTARQREELEEEVKALFDKYSRDQVTTGSRSIVRFACATLSGTVS